MNAKGVSEIIGEMLLLSLVLILIAVLSSNLLGSLPTFEETPQVKFLGLKDSNGNITITHEGGEPISIENLKIVIFGENRQFTCGIVDQKLKCNEKDFGEFHGQEIWFLGDRLTIYNETLSEEINSEKVQIIIATENQVICKLFFGW